jgi:hypothetical protein
VSFFVSSFFFFLFVGLRAQGGIGENGNEEGEETRANGGGRERWGKGRRVCMQCVYGLMCDNRVV